MKPCGVDDYLDMAVIASGDIQSTLDDRFTLHYGGGLGGKEEVISKSGVYVVQPQSNDLQQWYTDPEGVYNFTIDWGDGSAPETFTDDTDPLHEYVDGYPERLSRSFYPDMDWSIRQCST
jgi:hypothetical protein